MKAKENLIFAKNLTSEKMEKRNVNLEAYGAKIMVTPGGAVFVEINGTTVYFENGSLGRILSAQSDDMEQFDFPEFRLDPEEKNEFTITF